MFSINKLHQLKISQHWKIRRNVFFDIDPSDELSEDYKFCNIYCQEDLLWMSYFDYNLDLGWYGDDDLDDENTGFMLVLYRGEDWNNCELLELKRTKSKKDIVDKIEEISEVVISGFFDDKKGYEISENQADYRYIGQHRNYSVMNNFNELLK